MQRLLNAVADAHSLTAFSLAAWQGARVLPVHLVEAVLAARACRPLSWPLCPACGVSLRRQGCATRPVTRLCGPIRWRRRVGRGPQGCASPQVAPCAEALGGQPPQRSRGALPSRGCALAGFGPFATAARGLSWDSGGPGSPRAVWCWGQAAGQRAMGQLPEPLDAVAHGHLPTPDPLEATPAALPLALGADGVRVPCRPEAGQPTGKIPWRALKVGGLAR
jgi:hypothetical protein